MLITELKELTQILYFEGEYALFRAKDEQGSYRGVINRKGEIVWNVKWRPIMMRVHGYPNIFKTTDPTKKGFVYFDVEQLAFVDAPVMDDIHKSKAQLLVDNAKEVPFFADMPDFFSYKSLRYLSDDYIGFSEERMNWGVRDLDGHIIFPVQFYDIGPGGEPNHFVVTLPEDKQEGVIDAQGQWIIPPVYHSLFWRRAYYVAYIQEGRKKRKAGLLDQRGKVLIPFEYDYLIPSYTEDLISVKKRGRYFFINSKNERVKLF